MTISSSKAGTGRSHAAKNLTLSVTPTLNGQWKASYTDASGAFVGRALYALASEMIGRLFPGGIHTVEELELAERIAGLRPDEIPLVSAAELAWAKAELRDDLVATGTSRCARISDASQLDALRSLVADLAKVDDTAKDGPTSSKAWKARASSIKFVVAPYGCDIPDELIDTQLVEFDIARRERAAAAKA